MKKAIAFFVLFSLAVMIVSAAPIWTLPVQDAPDNNTFTKYDSALGIAWVSFAEEIPCLSYQHWLTPTFGYSLSSGGYYVPDTVTIVSEDNPYEYTTHEFIRSEFSLFGQVQWALYTASNAVLDTRLYTWVMGGIDLKSNPNKTTGDYFTKACFSAGFGFDITGLQHFSFPLEFGYSIQGPDDFKIGMNGQVGMRYRY